MTGLSTRMFSTIVGAVAVLAATALAGCSPSASASLDGPSAPPLVQPTAPLSECPTRFLPPAKTGHGELVAPIPDSAILCTYTFDDNTVTLTKAQVLEHGMTELVDYLNALPTRDDEGDGGNTADACVLAGAPQFTIVFGYPDGSTAPVSIDVNCGRIGGTDTARRVTSLSTILNYWR